MELKEIQDLLEKFYNAETNPEEEKVLIEYFKNEDIPDELFKEKAIFSHMIEQNRDISRDLELENEIWDKIENYEAEKKTRILQYGKQYFIRIAASIIILFGVYFMFQQQYSILTGKDQPRDTFDDPQMAYAELKKTMLYISGKMNQGTSHLDVLPKMEEVAEELKPLGKLDQGINELNPMVKIKLGVKYLN